MHRYCKICQEGTQWDDLSEQLYYDPEGKHTSTIRLAICRKCNNGYHFNDSKQKWEFLGELTTWTMELRSYRPVQDPVIKVDPPDALAFWWPVEAKYEHKEPYFIAWTVDHVMWLDVDQSFGTFVNHVERNPPGHYQSLYRFIHFFAAAAHEAGKRGLRWQDPHILLYENFVAQWCWSIKKLVALYIEDDFPYYCIYAPGPDYDGMGEKYISKPEELVDLLQPFLEQDK